MTFFLHFNYLIVVTSINVFISFSMSPFFLASSRKEANGKKRRATPSGHYEVCEGFYLLPSAK